MTQRIIEGEHVSHSLSRIILDDGHGRQGHFAIAAFACQKGLLTPVWVAANISYYNGTAGFGRIMTSLLESDVMDPRRTLPVF